MRQVCLCCEAATEPFPVGLPVVTFPLGQLLVNSGETWVKPFDPLFLKLRLLLVRISFRNFASVFSHLLSHEFP